MRKNIVLTILLFILIILLVVLAPICYKAVKAYHDSNSFANSVIELQQKNEETIFSIDKITYFSSCNAKGDTNSNSSFTISDLYQYTDIAIFLNPGSETLTNKNTLKSVVIDNIDYILTPSIGSQSLYYKNLNNFATPSFSEKDLIDKSLTFETTSENNIDYTKPVLYNNCANPITICYVNSNLKNSYTFSNNVSNLAYNGSLLKMCGIAVSSLNCKISLNITITNYLDETYFCPVTLSIPLSTDVSTIYDGSLTVKDDVDYKFIRIN